MVMDESSANNPDQRAATVWDRLLGCFGDSLLRKFGATPNPEWTAGIDMLADREIERGMRRIVFGWKGAPPNLPDFMRLCRTIGDAGIEEGPQPMLALPAPDNFAGDAWDQAANKYLLGHIAKRVSENTRCYGAPNSEDMAAKVAKLVTAKNSWAADMRDLDRGQGVPPDTQKAVWYDYFNTAEQGM